MIGKELVTELLSYDSNTGIFTWNFRDQKHFKTKHAHQLWNTRYAGRVAGAKKNDSGYIIISIKKTFYRAHRLAWLISYGSMPKNHIDHINGRRDDNCLSNLRDVTKLENNKNRRLSSNNKTGYHGITIHSNGRFRAKSYEQNKQVHIGYFASLGDAVVARKNYEKQNGFHPNHGVEA